MSPFDALVPLLVDAIPAAVASLKPTKPICILRLYFFDTHAPCAYLLLKSTSTDERTRVLAEGSTFHLWAAGEGCGDEVVTLPPDRPEEGKLAAMVRLAYLFLWPSSRLLLKIEFHLMKVYDLLCEDEDEYMAAYREMLREVARQLNAKDWSKVCPVTDDFVVVPADGSQHFGGEDYEDLVASVPSARLALLRSRGLLDCP